MEEQRTVPMNEVDAQFMTIETAWGKEVTQELNNRLKVIGKKVGTKTFVDDAGHKTKMDVVETESLWELLSFYTRDFRLSNMDSKDIEYCTEYIDFAGDCLSQKYVNSFITALSRAITRSELCQSRGGFVRKRLGTLTNEQVQSTLEPKKKTLFGRKKEEG